MHPQQAVPKLLCRTDSSRGWAPLIYIIYLVGLSGCIPSHREPPRSAGAALTRTEDILHQCIAAYDRLNTLQAKGILSDYRHGQQRVVPISWDLARPGRCRLQIDNDMVIIHGADSWTFRSATGRFQGSRSSRASPIQNAASMLSDGVPFLLPDLWENSKAALGRDPARGFTGWRLQGVAWTGDRPCYVFVKRSDSSGRGNLLRVWIDQDLLLVRGWTVVNASDDGREKTNIDCTYHHTVTNGRLSSNRFQLQPPEPIDLRDSVGGTAATPEMNR